MKIKTYTIDINESNRIYETIKQYRPIELNQCYLNTFAVANFLKSFGKKYKNYKVVYGFMKVVSDKEKGYKDWQYNSYVRHAFLVNDKNKVIDISYMHLQTVKPEKEPPLYLIMKKYSIDEYLSIVMDLMKGNPSEISLTFDEQINNETSFRQEAEKNGYILVD